MKIKKQDFQAFKDLCRSFMKEERDTTSKKLVEHLKNSRPELYKVMIKAIGKGNVPRYVGSSLLRSLQKEGWLTYEDKLWRTKAEWGFCTYCFEPLRDVYLIDIDHNQFCDGECFDDYGTVDHYDSYVDDYLFLFWDFKELKERYRFYMEREIKPSFATHLELVVLQQNIFEVLNDDCYSTVLFTGGDDGPVAAEMYRMLIILNDELEIIEDLIERCKKVLPETNQLYSIEIDKDILRKRNRPEILREFIRTHRKYRNKEQTNKWVTAESKKRSSWYNLLTEVEELKDKIQYKNEIKCPQCEKVEDYKWSRRVIDGFFYCEECYKKLEFHYKLRR